MKNQVSLSKKKVRVKEEYNPADDPYYKQEWLYVDKEIK